MRSPSPSPKHLLKNLLSRGLLALALLFAQQTAALHWLSHAVDATHAKASHGSAPADHCDECLALSALGAAASSAGITLPAGLAQHARVALPPVAPSPAALRLGFHSRAPPILS